MRLRFIGTKEPTPEVLSLTWRPSTKLIIYHCGSPSLPAKPQNHPNQTQKNSVNRRLISLLPRRLVGWRKLPGYSATPGTVQPRAPHVYTTIQESRSVRQVKPMPMYESNWRYLRGNKSEVRQSNGLPLPTQIPFRTHAPHSLTALAGHLLARRGN